MSLDDISQDLASLQQFCLRVGKQPYIGDGQRKNSFTSTGWSLNSEGWLSFSEARSALQKPAKVWHEGKMQPATGIGFLVAKSTKDERRPLGGDLDCCRDPLSGAVSSWATAFLQKVRPFYTEVSPSKCGLRFFAWGHLPGGIDSIFGNGPDDLPEDSRERILEVKPEAREKLEMGKPAFNGLEFYEANRHLTLTGDRLEEFCHPSEDQTKAIEAALEPFVLAEAINRVAEGVKTSGSGGKLPKLSILDVINTNGFTESGGQLFGSHPTEGSTTGKNLVVNPSQDVYCWMHDGINAGGDPWTWLACESGAVAWEQAGPGVLKDASVMKQTLEHAVKRGLVSADILSAPRVDTEAILTKIKADPRALKDPAILAALAALKINDPIEYDLLIETIRKTHKGLRVDTIRSLVDTYISDNEKAQAPPKGAPQSTKDKARAIAERGDSFRYLVWQAQRNHLGDIDMHKVLISSIASGASETSHGLQPGNNGDSGSGKDDACEAAYHLVPSDRKLDGSLSPMSLFYLEKDGLLKPGMVLYSDDVEYLPIIPIYKRSSARFQQYTNHYSVSSGKERTGLKMTIPPRMVWWMTSVESVANLEAFGRQYPISTDSSPAHKQKVATEIAARRARKELKLAEDEGIEVAREIIADIFDNGPFKVLIPQTKKAKWLKVSDFRGQEQFWDLVDAQVILHWRQRQRDESGWLIAEDQDLIEAKDIHSGHKVAHFSNLTEAEAKVIGVMSSGYSMTQKELTEALDVAQSTLSVRLKSIMAKSAIITEDYDQGKKVYALNPKMNLGTDYWNGLDLIELGLDSIKTYRSQQIALSGCYRYVIGLPIGIIINNSNRIPSSLSVNKSVSMERGYPCDDCESCPLKEYLSSLHIPDKSTDNEQNQLHEPLSDPDKTPITDPISTYNDSSEHPDTPIRHTDGPTAIEKVRIIKPDGYRTQILDPDNSRKWINHLFNFGEVVEFDSRRAQDLIKRGVAEAT